MNKRRTVRHVLAGLVVAGLLRGGRQALAQPACGYEIGPTFNGDMTVAKGINQVGQIIAEGHSDDLDATVGVLLSPSQQGLLGDLNGDGVVSAGDVVILLGSWGPCEDCGACAADLDGNGVVVASDLLLLLANWG